MLSFASALRTIERLSPERVVSLYLRRTIDAAEQEMRTDWKNAKRQNLLLAKYDVVAELKSWLFKTDPDATGEKSGYASPGFDAGSWTRLRSGSCWEDQGFPGYNGNAFYRTEITVPEAAGKYALLFEGADEKMGLVDGVLSGSIRCDPACFGKNIYRSVAGKFGRAGICFGQGDDTGGTAACIGRWVAPSKVSSPPRRKRAIIRGGAGSSSAPELPRAPLGARKKRGKITLSEPRRVPQSGPREIAVHQQFAGSRQLEFVGT